MKKILFVINSLTIGGSEKSLVSLLNTLDYSKYSVDLLMIKKGEEFDKYIPKQVNVLKVPEYYQYLHNTLKIKSIIKKVRYSICRYKCSIELRINGKIKNKINNQQIFYKNQKSILDLLPDEYDVAIAYAQGFPTYFIVDKVIANKKIAWINCDYTATLYDKKVDKEFYDKIDKIIAVSEAGRNSIINVNKEYENKIEVIKDIVNPKLITDMANEENVNFDGNNINIVTVARLVQGYKGYDLAIKAAKLLKDSGQGFKWYSVGDGHDRKKIETLIKENNVEKYFILLGAKENPYPYMKAADIYVQPSRKEGFGLTVIEAKILKKLIVSTNFETSKEIINNKVDGLIVGQDSKELYNGIITYIDNKELVNKIENNLDLEKPYNSILEIEKIYKIINN